EDARMGDVAAAGGSQTLSDIDVVDIAAGGDGREDPRRFAGNELSAGVSDDSVNVAIHRDVADAAGSLNLPHDNVRRYISSGNGRGSGSAADQDADILVLPRIAIEPRLVGEHSGASVASGKADGRVGEQ